MRLYVTHTSSLVSRMENTARSKEWGKRAFCCIFRMCERQGGRGRGWREVGDGRPIVRPALCAHEGSDCQLPMTIRPTISRYASMLIHPPPAAPYWKWSGRVQLSVVLSRICVWIGRCTVEIFVAKKTLTNLSLFFLIFFFLPFLLSSPLNVKNARSPVNVYWTNLIYIIGMYKLLLLFSVYMPFLCLSCILCMYVYNSSSSLSHVVIHLADWLTVSVWFFLSTVWYMRYFSSVIFVFRTSFTYYPLLHWHTTTTTTMRYARRGIKSG